MKKILLSALVIFIIFFAISESCKTRLSKKNLSWNPYEKGDEIILKSNLGSIDSIKILKVEKRMISPSSVGSGIKQWQELDVWTNTGESFTLINMSPNGLTLWVMNNQDDRYFGGLYSFENDSLVQYVYGVKKAERDTSLIVLDNNQKIKNCYKLADYGTIELIKQNPKIDYQNFIKYVYWNKEIGLLGYERYSGEIFKLSNYKK